MTEERVLEVLIRALKITKEEAQKLIIQAKASSMVGVAGFWS